MSTTESERHELYELAKHEVGDRFAELMMKSLPEHPYRLATKDDLLLVEAGLRTDMAEMEIRLVTRIHDEITSSTRTVVLSLVSSVTALAIANTLTVAFVR